MQASKLQQSLIDALRRNIQARTDQFLRNIDIVGKQPGICAQNKLKHFIGIAFETCLIESALVHDYHHTRTGGYLLDIFDIAGIGQNGKRIAGNHRPEAETFAEEREIEFIEPPETGAYSHFQKVTCQLIDTAYRILFGESFVETPRKDAFILSRNYHDGK